MSESITRFFVYLVCFAFSFYGLSGLDFAKLLRKGKVTQAQFLLVLFSMALAYLVANFILGLRLL